MHFVLFLSFYSQSTTTLLNKQLIFLKVGALLLSFVTGISSQFISFIQYPKPEKCSSTVDDARKKNVYYVSEEIVVSFNYNEKDKRTIDDFEFKFHTYLVKDPDQGIFAKEIETEIDFEYEDGSFKMEPYAAKPGVYVLVTHVHRKGERTSSENYRCFLVIVPDDPEAVIEGGSSRIVAPNVDFEVDGSQSNNANYKEYTNEGLTYLWTCTQQMTPPTFCKGDWTSKQKRLTIPAKHVVDEDEFVFTLKVTTEWGTYGSVSQKIYVLKNSINLVLKCHKNCPPVAATSEAVSSTFLEAFCRQNCRFVTDNDLFWTIISKTDKKFTFDYKTGTRFGRVGRKFVIKENVLKPGIYNISVTLRPGHKRKAYSSIIIEYVGVLEVKDCRVTPEKGESLKTSFTFKCVQSPPNQRNYYKLVYMDTKDSSKTVTVTEGYYPDVFGEKFVLSPSKNKKLSLVIITHGSPKPKIVPLKVQVTPGLANKPSIEVIKIVNSVYSGTTQSQSIKELAKSSDPGDRRKAIQIMTSLVEELTDTKNDDPVFNDFIRTLKIQATKDLLDIPVTRGSTILKIGEMLTKLNDFKSPPQTDTEIAKTATSVCNTITDKMLKMMKKKKNVLSMSDKSKALARFVSRCLKSHAKANLKIMEPVKLNISGRFPPTKEKVDQSVLTENYPDYEDHGPNYYNDLTNLRTATGRTLNASMKMAKALAFTTAIGEGIIKTEGEYDTTLVLKDLGKEIAVSEMASDGVILIPSQDFANETHPFDVLLTIWKQDIMWWNPNHTNVATNIAIVQFWHSTCKKRIYDFFQPVEIFFAKRPGFVFDEKPRNGSFNVSDNCDQASCPQVLQFAVPKRRTLYVNFTAISKINTLKFITTYFKFPTMEDFGNGTVNEFDSINTSFVNKEDYDVLVYVGILSVDNKPSTSISYSVQAKITNCIRWSMKANQWELSCYPGDNGNSSVVDCKCYHFSAIAGYFENIMFLEKTIQDPDLELRLVSNKIICITLVVTFFLFCIPLLLILLPKKKIKVYYLADNNTKHRFAYLLTVKTGFRFGAGTSSNVTIRLHGNKKSSEPHVLNYPDPKKSLLQSFGEDMFLLSTESSLGELEEMELWFDSLGENPTWRCREVYVYDMQQHIEWRFKVQTKFSVVKGATYCAIEPFIEEKSTIQKKNKINLSQRFHVWYFCQREEQISYLKKLTIVLSTLLTIYFLTLLCYGLPEILLRDCLDIYKALEVNSFTVLVAFVSSFSAFVLHSIIIWGFRLSKLQYWKHGRVPLYLTIACWLLLIGLIIISTTFLTVYGFWMPYYTSLCWLISCLIGIAFDVFIYEIIFAVIQNLFMKNHFKRNVVKMYKYILQSTEYQRKYLHSKFGHMILRPYFKHLYTPIKKKRFKKVQKLLIHRYSIISEFEDLLMFSIYIIILYVVVLANKDRLMVVSKNDMRDLLTGLHTRSITFEKLDELEDIYKYINLTLIEVLHSAEWYDNFSISEPALMKDMVNKYLGVVRMRQQRIEPNACEVAPKMRFLNTSCWPEYSFRFLETRTFGVGWKQSVNPIAATHDRLRNIWKYQTKAETGSIPTIGQFATYTGGGYIHYLGRKAYNSVANFLRMLQDEWINTKTRVIFIEFMTYNQNFNVFSSIRLMIEQSASGYILRDVYVQSVRMLFVHNEVERISSIFFVLFIFWVVILLLKQSVSTVKRIRSFYKDVWFLIDMIIVLMSLACIGMFAFRMKLVQRYLNKLEKVKNNEFINYFYLFQIEYGLNFVAACLLCTATVRLWKFLRFAAMFRVMERTLLVAGKLLLSFSVAILLMLVTFALPLTFLTGNYFVKIHTTVKLIKLMLIMALKPKEMGLPAYLRFRSATFYVVLYILIFTIVIYTVMMIIVMSYYEAKLYLSSEKMQYNIRSFVQEKSHYIPRYIRYKYKYLRGGVEAKPKVEPKPDNFYYVRCRSIIAARLKKMTSIARCFFRNQTQYKKPSSLSESDVQMMLKVCRDYLIKSDKERAKVFFIGHVHGQRRQFVEEENISKIAFVVDCLLQEKEPEFEEREEWVPDKKFEKCAKMIEQKQDTLKKCDLMLKLCLQKMYKIQRVNIKRLGR